MSSGTITKLTPAPLFEIKRGVQTGNWVYGLGQYKPDWQKTLRSVTPLSSSKQKYLFPSSNNQKYLFPSPHGEGARRADEVRGGRTGNLVYGLGQYKPDWQNTLRSVTPSLHQNKNFYFLLQTIKNTYFLLFMEKVPEGRMRSRMCPQGG